MGVPKIEQWPCFFTYQSKCDAPVSKYILCASEKYGIGMFVMSRCMERAFHFKTINCFFVAAIFCNIVKKTYLLHEW